MTMIFIAARSSQKPIGQMVEGDVLWQRIVGYTADIGKARDILAALTEAHRVFQEDPENVTAYEVIREYDHLYDFYTRWYELVGVQDYDS